MSNQRFSEEFKIEAVRQVTERGLPVAEVTPRLGMSAHSLYAWIKRYSKPATLFSEAGRSLRKPGLFKQPGSHAYKQATVEQPDIPNWLSHEFTTERSNQVCCGDITYIWGKVVGFTWRRCWICIQGELSAGHFPTSRMQSWSSSRQTGPASSEASRNR